MPSPHLFHYEMLILALPAVLWLQASLDDRIAGATREVKPILAAGFLWLVLAGPIANTWPLQLSPVLMLLCLAVLLRALTDAETTAAGEPATLAADQTG